MKATIALKSGESREVTLYKRPMDRLKKSAASKARWVKFPVNGVEADVKVTSNAKWAANPEMTIEYPWFELEGFAYWFSLKYREKAEDVASVVTAEGSAVKFTPRVTTRTDAESERIALQRKTWYENRSKDMPDDLKTELVKRGMIEAEPVAEEPVAPKRGKKDKVEA